MMQTYIKSVVLAKSCRLNTADRAITELRHEVENQSIRVVSKRFMSIQNNNADIKIHRT